MKYVVAYKRKGERETWYAEVVDDNSPTNAAEQALEGRSWAVDDGTYETHVLPLDGLEPTIVRKATETTIEVQR